MLFPQIKIQGYKKKKKITLNEVYSISIYFHITIFTGRDKQKRKVEWTHMDITFASENIWQQ